MEQRALDSDLYTAARHSAVGSWGHPEPCMSTTLFSVTDMGTNPTENLERVQAGYIIHKPIHNINSRAGLLVLSPTKHLGQCLVAETTQPRNIDMTHPSSRGCG